jgi:signal transduction histidine kinase
MNRIVAPLLLITILAQAIYCYLKQIQFAIFAVTSFTVLVIFFSIYSFHQNGLIVSNSFTSHSHYWGLAIEASIIAFSLAWRYKTYKEEAERLLIENFRIQDNILKETAQWQEKELERISSLLHDTVGANVGLLRLHADAMPLTEDGRGVLANQITALGNEIRQMSHALSPLKLQHHGLQVALQDLVQQIKQSTSLNLQLEWLGNKKALDFQYEIIIYRTVQEALQNMLKHAHAKEAIVQVLLEDDLISIYIEDDGVGSHTNQPFDGIGLKSIEKLVQLLNGTFQIKTSPQAGFSLSVEFKTLNHESLSSRHR